MKTEIYEARQSCHIPGVRAFKAGERIEVAKGGKMSKLLLGNPYFSYVVQKQKPAKKSGRKRRNKKSR